MNTSVEYSYRNINDIYILITPYIDFSFIHFLVLFILCFLLYTSIFYIFPSIKIYLESLKKEHETKNKKLILKQILIQKEIESSVEKEMEEENKKL